MPYKQEYEKMRRVYEAFKAGLDEGQHALFLRTEALEHSLQKLTQMYYELVSQRSMLRVDKQVNEKRVQRLTTKVQQLKGELQEAVEQRDLDQQQISLLISKIQTATTRSSMFLTSNVAIPKNIRKTIRGGGALPITPRAHEFRAFR